MKVNSKVSIINHLKNSAEPLSGEELSRRLGISRTAIWKNIKKLTAEGYTITSSHTGYLLKREDDLLLPYEFIKDIELYIYRESTDSTMDIARELIQTNKAKNGTIIITESQSAGRGKGLELFDSPIGGLYFTMILFPDCPLMDINLYPMAALIAVKETLEKQLSLDIDTKWPFESWNNGKKIAGILHEYSVKGNRCQWMTIGIGLTTGTTIPRREILVDIKKSLLELISNPESIRNRYIRTLDMLNKDYTFCIEGKKIKGRVKDIDNLGTLLIDCNGLRTYGYIGNSTIKEQLCK